MISLTGSDDMDKSAHERATMDYTGLAYGRVYAVCPTGTLLHLDRALHACRWSTLMLYAQMDLTHVKRINQY